MSFGRQSNAKFGAGENDLVLLASNCIHRAGRSKNDTGLMSTCEVRPESAPHADEQTHVVRKGHPRHHRCVRRGNVAVGAKIVGHHLFDIGP